ncbi:hypothetical protein ACFWIP_39460, partial [Streptomyces anulatus]
MDEDEAATPNAARERFWRGRDVAFTPVEPDDAELIHRWRGGAGGGGRARGGRGGGAGSPPDPRRPGRA